MKSNPETIHAHMAGTNGAEVYGWWDTTGAPGITKEYVLSSELAKASTELSVTKAENRKLNMQAVSDSCENQRLMEQNALLKKALEKAMWRFRSLAFNYPDIDGLSEAATTYADSIKSTLEASE
ncbi:hypothetical protein DEM26_18090 [Thioclava sp. NG1]|uniref:hypothetical protein n=1 Tax=Thioclava sp. NG1 TaxID=2182426 RepID=UPI000D6040F4|nr:hypothetical protein [Thioclava sp. NG1]PWE48459.1 hypothetical protein DEM26_18090 [Thioclava sp. NG1]